MKLQIASDLHHEMAPPLSTLSSALEIDPRADVLVLAGDVHRGPSGVEFYADAPIPVVYVPGNHEFFGGIYPWTVDDMKGYAEGTSVVVLECDEWTYRDVTFLGAVLWSDFVSLAIDPQFAIDTARSRMGDFQFIRTPNLRIFRPEDALLMHWSTVKWLQTKLEARGHGRTVVVTHHAPSARSIPSARRGSPLAPCYASSLESLVTKADLWIHGHVHSSSNYLLGDTRVICNPRGVPRRNRVSPSTPYSNAEFNHSLIVEI
ncbi:metallophosphoesterase [Burkholderia sp. PU8-34]